MVEMSSSETTSDMIMESEGNFEANTKEELDRSSGVGFEILPDVRVELRMGREELEETLNNSGIKYITAYDSDINGVRETIMLIADYGVELTLKNGYVNYIKSANMPHSFITKVIDVEDISSTVIEVLKQLRDKTKGRYNIKVEKLNTETISLVASLKSKIHIGVAKSISGDVYISTLRDLTNK